MMLAYGRKSFAVLQKEIAVKILEQNATCKSLEQSFLGLENFSPLCLCGISPQGCQWDSSTPFSVK